MPAVSLLVSGLLGGCGKVAILNPAGPIGRAERDLILTALGLMMIVVVPVILMALWFPRRYSASRKDAAYTPKWTRSAKLELIVWLVPIAIVTTLGHLAWSGAHRLDPFRPMDRGVKPVNVEVVAMDWKWLFIYPDQDIAVINKLVFPAGTPLSFRITSDTVVNSFFIPRLGSQMYAMAGMVSRLHLLADKPGLYYGQSQQFSGKGYAGMHFEARAVSAARFKDWLENVRRSPDRLDAVRFKKLEKPSIDAPVTYFSNVEPGLFDRIVGSFVNMGPMAKARPPVRPGVAGAVAGVR